MKWSIISGVLAAASIVAGIIVDRRNNRQPLNAASRKRNALLSDLLFGAAVLFTLILLASLCADTKQPLF